MHESELQHFKDVFKATKERVNGNREEAIKVLHSAGICDEHGKLVYPYADYLQPTGREQEKTPMKILVTAGNTEVPIDKVRCISNIFKGKTGAQIAFEFSKAGHEVTLLTSHAPAVFLDTMDRPTVKGYRTYDDLLTTMESEITRRNYDVIIHSAAVSDYGVDEVCYVADEKYIDGKRYVLLQGLDSTGKVGSDHTELYPKMVPTEKIVDKIRDEWGYNGILVKFKLQVDMSHDELIRIAEASRKWSGADFIVANTLETMNDAAYIVCGDGTISMHRTQLPEILRDVVTAKFEGTPTRYLPMQGR